MVTKGGVRVGRSKYETMVAPYIDRVTEWVRLGATEQEIADKLGVSCSSLRRYLSCGRSGDERYKALSDAFDAAKEEPDDNVEAALYKRATGYNVPVVKHFKLRRVEYDEATGRKISEKEELVEALEEEHVPADTKAQIFWLINRRPERWQNNPTQNTEDVGGGIIEIPGFVATETEKDDG